MASKYKLGASLVLNEGNFFTNMKKAQDSSSKFKGMLGGVFSSSSKTSGGLNNMGNSLGSVAKKTLGAVAAFAGFNQIKNGLTECVTGVMELERANNRLETLMLNTAGNTKEMVSGIIEYGDALEMVTTIEGDASVAGASQLATFQLQGDTIKSLLPSLQNLAAAQYGVDVSQDNMIQSANLLGKVMMGQTGALSKAGVSFTEAQKKILQTGTESEKTAALIQVLDQNFGGLAESMAQTKEGKIIQLRNAWGSVKDEIGMGVMPAVDKVTTFLTSNIPNIREKISGAIDRVSPMIENLTGKLIDGCESAAEKIGWVADNWDKIGPVLAGVAISYGVLKTSIVGVETATRALTAAKTIGTVVSKAASAAANSEAGIRLWMAGVKIKEAVSTGALTVATKAQTAATKLAAGGQKLLNAAFVSSPIGWIVLGVTALVATFVLLWNKCDWFRNFFIGMWDKIKAVMPTVKEAIHGAIVKVWDKIKAVWNTVKPYFTMIWENIKVVFNAGKENIAAAFNVAWTLIKAVWGNTGAYFKALWNTIKGIFSVVKNVLSGNWQGAWDAIKGIVGGWRTYFSTIWNNIAGVFSSVGNYFGTIFSNAVEIVKGVFGNVLTFFQEIWNKIKSMFTGIGLSIAEGISGAFKTVINSVIRFAGNLINKFISSVNGAIDLINNHIPGVSINRLQEVNLPMLAKGGIIQRSGSVIVGERGPEILHLNRGAMVQPLPAGGGGNTNTFYITVYAEKGSDGIDEFVRKVKEKLDNM